MSLERHGCAALLILFLVLFTINLDKPEMTGIDECRSGVIVRDMVEGGRWLLPRTPDGYLTEKPLAYYGSSALLSLVVGTNEWGLRGISVLAAIGTLALAWFLARLYGSKHAAAIAVISLAANVYFLTWARKAMVDMTMTFFLTAGLATYFAARMGRIRAMTAGWLGGLAFGLAVLTKGPLGLAFPVVVMAVDRLVAVRWRPRDIRIAWKPLFAALGVVIAVSATWYVPGFLKGGKEFLYTSLLDENFFMPLGLKHGIAGSHMKSPGYYPSIQLMILFPIAALIPQTVRWCFSRDAGPGRTQMAVWFVAGFIFFMIPSNKRQYYLVPLQPAVAVLVGLAIDRCLASARESWLRLSILFMGILLLVVTLAGAAVCLKPELVAFVGQQGGIVLDLPRALIGGFFVLTLSCAIFLIAASRSSSLRMAQAAMALAVLLTGFRTCIYDLAGSRLDKTKPAVSRMTRVIPAGALVAVHPQLYGYGVDFYWPGRLPRDPESEARADWIIVRRAIMGEVPGPTEIVDEFIYDSADHGMVLLKKIHGRR